MVDGVEVDSQHVASSLIPYSDGQLCQITYVIVDHWSTGEHSLISRITIKNKIDVNHADFGPGVLENDYKVTVLNP